MHCGHPPLFLFHYCNRRNFRMRFNFVYFVLLAESTKISSIRKRCTYTSVCETALAVRKFIAYESSRTPEYEFFTRTKISAITVPPNQTRLWQPNVMSRGRQTSENNHPDIPNTTNDMSWRYTPRNFEKPFGGTRDVPVTNWRKRAFISLSNEPNAWVGKQWKKSGIKFPKRSLLHGRKVKFVLRLLIQKKNRLLKIPQAYGTNKSRSWAVLSVSSKAFFLFEIQLQLYSGEKHMSTFQTKIITPYCCVLFSYPF